MAAAATPQQADITAYEHTPYPAVVHPMTHPDRLAVLARLAGVAAPDVATARILDVGCANGLNILAFAAAYPAARFVGIDLVPEAIERGASLARRAGLDNADLRVADFTDPAALEGEFDYIIAHGLLAWVTPDLGEALLALIERHLAPTGVAFVSFNALPGCYVRMAARDAMMRVMDPAASPPARLVRARAMLERIGVEQPGDSAIQHAFRVNARQTAMRPLNVLEHDELTRHYNPRYLEDVIAQARGHGLEWLGDTRKDQIRDGFLAAEADEALVDPAAAVVVAACVRDFVDSQLFRAAVFTRIEAWRGWRCDLAAMSSLYALCGAREIEPGHFGRAGEAFQIGDAALADAMRAMIAAHPRRVPVASLALDGERLAALFSLFDLGLISLHTGPEPFVLDVGLAPVVSPLIRTMLADGEEKVPTLDHSMLTPTGAARDLLLALDGSGRTQAFHAAVAAAGFTDETALDDALASVAALGVLVR